MTKVFGTASWPEFGTVVKDDVDGEVVLLVAHVGDKWWVAQQLVPPAGAAYDPTVQDRIIILQSNRWNPA